MQNNSSTYLIHQCFVLAVLFLQTGLQHGTMCKNRSEPFVHILDRKIRIALLQRTNKRFYILHILRNLQLTTLAADTVALKSELTVLQAENVSLTAQHEQMFDMATVKEVAAAAGMAKPTSSQITYLDLDSEDSAVVYRTETPSVFSRILSSLHHGVYAVVEYFD